MLGGLKRRALNASSDAMKDDLERFIAMLQGADDENLSHMLVVANRLRLNLVDMGKIPAGFHLVLDHFGEFDDYVRPDDAYCELSFIPRGLEPR